MPPSATPRGAAVPVLPRPSASGKRYLLVLDTDLPAAYEQLGLEPINYLVARQQQEQCEVAVLSLVSTRQARMPSMELLLGANRGVFPRAPRPDHDISAAAEHRMDLAVQHLQTIGCHDKVILVTSREGGRWSARAHLDPVHQLRRRLGQRLIIFPSGPGTSHSRS